MHNSRGSKQDLPNPGYVVGDNKSGVGRKLLFLFKGCEIQVIVLSKNGPFLVKSFEKLVEYTCYNIVTT